MDNIIQYCSFVTLNTYQRLKYHTVIGQCSREWQADSS